MKTSATRLRRLGPAALLSALALALAFPSIALADRGGDRDRDRGHDRDRHDRHDRYDHRDRNRSRTHYSFGIGVGSYGVNSWHVGVSRDNYRRSPYYRPYYRTGFYPGFYVSALPRHHRRVVFDSTIYFVADDIYYRPYNRGYVVVERPVIIERERPSTKVRYEVTDEGIDPNREIGAPEPKPAYLSVWQDEQELRLIDGEFFKPTANGLVWVATPVGAVSDVLPIGAQPVWHQDIEYFRFDGVVFRKSPDGYKVVAAPWSRDAGAAN